ncbi:MAG: AAA family ATPase, partial [Saprospiraceae bacterium]|nr:AAA family ATPase [Saprospiraceae bacterium]
MYLKSLVLYNYKSYQKARFDFSAHLNIIYGRNGVGKTNLLDAIYTMAMTRSNFSITDQQLIHDSADFFRMEGLLVKPDGETSIVMKLPKGKKKV